MRTVSDPNSGQAYVVPIPTGKVGKVLNRALDQVGDQLGVRRRRSRRLGLLRPRPPRPGAPPASRSRTSPRPSSAV